MVDPFDKLATATAHAAGRPRVFGGTLLLIVLWAITGPFFHYSDTWQLIANTATTLATTLLVLLIQATQNRDATAIQLKLDELIRSSAARNEYVGIDRLNEDELHALQRTTPRQ